MFLLQRFARGPEMAVWEVMTMVWDGSSASRPLAQNCRFGYGLMDSENLIAQCTAVCDLKRGFLKPLLNGYDGSRRKRTTLRAFRNRENIVFKISRSV